MKQSDQRTRLTRRLIREAMMELLAQKPIQNISVKELCEKAGINRGTFYSHYVDIYDLLSQLEDEMLEDVKTALLPLLEDAQAACTPLRITTGVFQCLKDNADLCTVTLGPYGDKQFAARLLATGQEMVFKTYANYFEGVTRKDLEYYYAFVSAGCIGLLETWLKNGMTAPAAEIAQTAESIMLSGIGFLQKSSAQNGQNPSC